MGRFMGGDGGRKRILPELINYLTPMSLAFRFPPTPLSWVWGVIMDDGGG